MVKNHAKAMELPIDSDPSLEPDSRALNPYHAPNRAPNHSTNRMHMPVFDAFQTLGLTGRDIAKVAQVTPPTVSKWRTGTVKIPGERLAFLTLVLAHLIDELPTQTRTLYKNHVDGARADLVLQDVLNQELPVADIRQGVQCFRRWWSSPEAADILTKSLSKSISKSISISKTMDSDLRALKSKINQEKRDRL